MPFIPQVQRSSPDLRDPGSRCFVTYRQFKARWKENPRWRTVDEIAAQFWPNPFKRAAMLAFMVFFAFVVLDYERLKQAEHGDIE